MRRLSRVLADVGDGVDEFIDELVDLMYRDVKVPSSPTKTDEAAIEKARMEAFMSMVADEEDPEKLAEFERNLATAISNHSVQLNIETNGAPLPIEKAKAKSFMQRARDRCLKGKIAKVTVNKIQA